MKDMVTNAQRTVNGYMTIEATFITWWTFFLCILIIYISFFMYDKCILFQDTYAIGFRASNLSVSENEREAYIQNYWSQQIGQKYFAVDGIRKSVENSRKLCVKSALCVVHPFSTVDPTLPGRGMSAIVEVQVSKLNPTKFIRECRKVQSVIP